MRLDSELVRRKIVDSRERARALIDAGNVVVNGVVAHKPATQVEPDTSIAIRDAAPQWASRGAHKLIGALEAFGDNIRVQGARCLDAGASTGGFTDVLLARGADRVVAADVGYGQLVWRLQNDERVDVLDKTNVRALDEESIGGPVDLVVSDLSFISLTLVLPALARCTRPGGDLLPMVKPQFEVGKDRLGSGGVVRDAALRAGAVEHVARCAEALGLEVRGATASPLPGPSGNVEFFLWLRRPLGLEAITVGEAPHNLHRPAPAPRPLIERAVKEGPQDR
ncbi:TlyA family RNA methyltransferase [Dietzia sp.]|uniref:TlyA family RNA methyltransferase n=1 Tax=Dietzia sp. TaxID=1871616 RepID=UPI002FD94FCB